MATPRSPQLRELENLLDDIESSIIMEKSKKSNDDERPSTPPLEEPSSISSPTLTALRNKLASVEKEKSSLQDNIRTLTQQKERAVADEDYDRAHEIKTEIEKSEEGLKQKETQINKLRMGITAEVSLLEQKKTGNSFIGGSTTTTTSTNVSSNNNSDVTRKLAVDRYEIKKKELNAQKNKAVQDEDYDKASSLKEQLEQLEASHQKELSAINGKKEVSPSVTSTTKVVPTEPATKTLASSGSSGSTGRGLSKSTSTGGTIKKQYPQDSKLYDASRAGKLADVKRLVENENVDVDSIDFTTGNSALHAACAVACKPVILYLINKGAEINLKNRRGQTPLHLSVEKRLDDMTKLLVENGGNLYQADNTGKTPFALSGSAPSYQLELKEFMIQYEAKKRDAPPPVVSAEDSRSEAIQVYLRNGSYSTFQISDTDSCETVISSMATKLGLGKILEFLELGEEVMGKERTLKPGEPLLASRDKWPNNNPTYCKFMLKLQRGAPSPAQMAFREALYAKK